MANKDTSYNIIKAESRGHADHGWLISKHSFSFANYYNQDRIHFGALRVLNDDYVAPGEGFGRHPHDNMEIVSIPLSGELKHEDSIGNTSVIKAGEVQVMSAGSGIIHSEMNNRKDIPVEFLQIWVYPVKKSVTPRYQQFNIDDNSLKNRLIQIVSPSEDDEGLWIYQDAWFTLGEFDEKSSVEYTLKKNENGVYIFVIEGSSIVNGNILNKRDSLTVINADKLTLSLEKGSKILVIEIPMTW